MVDDGDVSFATQSCWKAEVRLKWIRRNLIKQIGVVA
jgi:hypothetical protein